MLEFYRRRLRSFLTMSRFSAKLWKRAVTLLRVGALVTLCVLLISPLRDALFFPVLPRVWRSHPSHRLVRMLMDNQHFPISELYAHGELGNATPALIVNLLDVDKFLLKEDPYAEFHKQSEALRVRLKSGDESVTKELAMMESFKPAMSLSERAQLVFTLDVFARACRQHGLTFFLVEGSTLGSHRHHGLIPWDDDVDLALNSSQWRLARRVLGSIPGFTLYSPPDSQWKFYLSSLPPFHDKPFKWPSLDLFFFSQQGPYIWSLTWGMKNKLLMHVQHLLPLASLPWEGLTLPSPACSAQYLQRSYGALDQCLTPIYVHKTNEEKMFVFQTQAVPCSRLHKYYPFVFRTDLGPAGVLEVLKVGDRVIHNRTLPHLPDACSQDM